jgi:predicted butyrate kinase (DUF1464 family)
MRAAGALDGEVAFLAGGISKSLVFSGGAAAVAGVPAVSAEELAASRDSASRIAWEAYIESAAKAVAALSVAVPQAHEVVLSGRSARSARVRDALAHRLLGVVDGVSVHALDGLAARSSQAAQGAALVADGLSGGASKTLVERMDLRGAAGTVLDHLFVVDRDHARRRLGI